VRPTPKRIVVLSGPTASGKSRVALGWAEALGGEIVSADSAAVYRGFDVGTAKPSAADRARVVHHGIDVVEADQPFDVVRFVALADAAIAAAGSTPVVVTGGTGLYLRALVRGLVDAPGPDPELRAELEAQAEREGRAAVHARLAEVDPAAAARLSPNDLVRVVRALEAYEQTGVPLSERQAAHGFGERRYDARFFALEVPADELAARIDARADAMIAAGLLDETRAHLGRFPRSVRPLCAVNYKQAVEHLVDGVPLEEAVRRMKTASRRYAKRQRTWLRGETGVEWIPASSPPAVDDVRRWIEA